MAISRWLCTQGTRNMLVKIVHPGGHVELHDRPLLAAEIMLRNPRCCIAYPHVFKNPWAIVPPDAMLMLGQKFYIVPISTIRKLQKLSQRQSPSNSQELLISKEEDEEKIPACWLFVNQTTPKIYYNCVKQNEDDKTPKQQPEKDVCVSGNNNCFMCLLTGPKLKPNGSDDSSSELRSTSTESPTETKLLNKKRSSRDYQLKKGLRGSPKRHASHDNWQPRLESICEEQLE